MSVKKARRGRPSSEQNRLSKEAILSTAHELLKADGKFPSIRKLARRLEVDAMAIYHYFPNKAALQEAISVSLMKNIYETSPDKDWKVNLTELCKSYLELLNEYSDLLETMLAMDSEGPAQVFTLKFNESLTPLELDDQTLQNALYLTADYLHGFALAMRSAPAGSSLKVDQLAGPLSLLIKALNTEVKTTR